MIQNQVVTLSAASIRKKFFHTGDWYGQKELTPPSCLAGFVFFFFKYRFFKYTFRHGLLQSQDYSLI